MPPCEGGEKVYKLEELFQSANGDFDIQKIHLNGKGEVVISSGESNNGVVGKTDIPAKVFSANTITVDMFGNSYYQLQPYKMVTHARVFSLSPINEMHLSEKIGLYIVAKIRYFKQMFSYNNMCSWEKIRQLTISMPLNKYGNIDFAYIEERVRELEEERVRELEAYLTAAGFSNCLLTPAEREALTNHMGGVIRSKLFRINELFNIKKGKRLTKASMKEGTINFIGATASNNGITAKIGNIGYVHPAGTITVSYNGSVGESFYQTSEFWASDDINVLYPKFKMSESVALYIMCPIRKRGKGYGYAYKWKKETMEKDSITLPVTADGSIDYTFMETYISAVKKQVISRLKEFIAREKAVHMQITYLK